MLVIEMMARWKILLSYGARKEEVGVVRLENGIIQGDAFSPLFVLMIDPFIKIVKN